MKYFLIVGPESDPDGIKGMTPEDAYEKFKTIIRDFNTLIETYAPPEYKKIWRVDPRQGTVAFGSAIHRFGLTIPALAEIWHEKTGI